MGDDRVHLEESRFELTEADLSKVSAGKFDGFANFGDIKGESTNKDHRDWIQNLYF
jgi:hypothetical protein